MEATIVCVDNSEWTRNGDYSPDRFQAQTDAVNLLAGSKMQDSPENGVGILTMAGKAPQVLVTPTSDLSKVLNCMASLKIDGEFSNIYASVQVAQLALKHRANKQHKQRIVVFSASPVTEEKEQLLKMAKNLKKNNVAVDIVCFGTGDDGVEKLESFCNAVQNSDNCHFITVPPGTILSDHLIGTAIFQGENAAAFGGETSMGDVENLGVDPNIDPELALALRVSMEEERARQNRVAAEAAAAAGESSNAAQTSSVPGQDTSPTETDDVTAEQDDERLQKAIAMSMQDQETSEPKQRTGDVLEDEELKRALQMSMEHTHGSSNSTVDPDFVNSVLASLPGVDPNSADLRELVESIGFGKKDEKEEDKKDDGNDNNDDDQAPPPSSSS
eukprot:g6392.t1